MSQNEIVALRCPSCGSGVTEPSRDKPFGAEFRCDGCGVTSVLIIHRDLVPLGTLQQQGEKVCGKCGNIVSREARFCQEGHTLLRKCNYLHCHKEFPVDHQRCDFCGGLQDEERFEVLEMPFDGTFHAVPKSGSPPFVELGVRVKKDQTLCVIQAFSSMMEYPSPYDGEVTAIHQHNAQPVKRGEHLFTIKLEIT